MPEETAKQIGELQARVSQLEGQVKALAAEPVEMQTPCIAPFDSVVEFAGVTENGEALVRFRPRWLASLNFRGR